MTTEAEAYVWAKLDTEKLPQKRAFVMFVSRAKTMGLTAEDAGRLLFWWVENHIKEAGEKIKTEFPEGRINTPSMGCSVEPAKHVTTAEGDCVPWCPACGPQCRHGNNSKECEECRLDALKNSPNDIAAGCLAAVKAEFDRAEGKRGVSVLAQIILDKKEEIEAGLGKPLWDPPKAEYLRVVIDGVVHGFAGSCIPMGGGVYCLTRVRTDFPLAEAVFSIRWDRGTLLKDLHVIRIRAGASFSDGTYLYEEMEVLDRKPSTKPCRDCAAQGFCTLEESRDGAPCSYFDSGPEFQWIDTEESSVFGDSGLELTLRNGEWDITINDIHYDSGTYSYCDLDYAKSCGEVLLEAYLRREGKK